MITLFKTNGGWNARFSGPAAEIIWDAFGTDTIPTAFTAAADAGKVQREIQANWPDCVVRIEGAHA